MAQEYEEFVEKFKPKRTTDDCYTPDLVYAAVESWAKTEYNLEGRPIVRPFWPGGDYEKFDYPENCVVIDNPPFSILAKIRSFYREQQIDFFLFAPHLTMFSVIDDYTNGIVTGVSVVYDNGASVSTSFITNLGVDFIRTAPELKKAVKDAVENESKKTRKNLPRYAYPNELVTTARIGKISDAEFRLHRKDCHFVRTLDSQKQTKKKIFGDGFLISKTKAAEVKVAEAKVAEAKAAENQLTESSHKWELSAREQKIVYKLGE